MYLEIILKFIEVWYVYWYNKDIYFVVVVVYI